MASSHPISDISWDDARLFLAVAERGSFTAAAEALALGQPTLSRRISDLEYQLGFTLFHRGKRGTTLTSDGERLVPAARQMARWAAELGRSIAGREQAPSGRVRLTMPPGLAVDFGAAFCKSLRSKYPELEVELLSSIAHLDLARGQADIAVRTREPTEPELAAIHRVRMPIGAFAHRSYAERLGPTPRPEELAWITWSYPNEHLPPRPQLAALIPNFRPAFASDDYVVQKRACALGMGVLLLPRVRHPFEPDEGLVLIDCGLPLPEGEMFLVCAKSMEHVPRVRAVAHELIREFDRCERIDA
jgi:DNA-binding transcriptional LysR family regulator